MSSGPTPASSNAARAAAPLPLAGSSSPWLAGLNTSKEPKARVRAAPASSRPGQPARGGLTGHDDRRAALARRAEHVSGERVVDHFRGGDDLLGYRLAAPGVL